MAVSIITTVLIAATATSPAGPYDLTDVVTAHDELSIPTTDTSNDTSFQRWITEISTAIANYCNRVFPVEAVQDAIYIQQDAYPWQTPGGIYPLQLSRWPIVNPTPISFTGNTHGSTLIDGVASTEGLEPGMLLFAVDGSFPPATTIDTVDANSIVTSEPATSSVVGQSLNTGLQVIQTLGGGEFQTLVYGTDFTVDAAHGWLIRLNEWTGVSERWEAEPVTVQYQAGYDPIPGDLNSAVLRMLVARFKARSRDPFLVQRDQGANIGAERYWVGTAKGQVGMIPPEIVGLLDNYRPPTVALMGVGTRGGREISLRFDSFPDRLHGKLVDRIEALTATLEERIEAIAPHKTGKLRSEIKFALYTSETQSRVAGYVSVYAGSDSNEYAKAATLEYGSNKPRRIPDHGGILRRLSRGQRAIESRLTKAPNIEARRYMRGPFEEMKPEIQAALEETMIETVAEDEA